MSHVTSMVWTFCGSPNVAPDERLGYISGDQYELDVLWRNKCRPRHERLGYIKRHKYERDVFIERQA